MKRYYTTGFGIALQGPNLKDHLQDEHFWEKFTLANEIEEAVELNSGEPGAGAGTGFGYRDVDWACETEAQARKVFEEIKKEFARRGLQYTVDTSTESVNVRLHYVMKVDWYDYPETDEEAEALERADNTWGDS